MDPFLIWVETSWLGVWVRESSSLMAFPFILILHTVGMGFVAGGNGAVALRILGFAPEVPLIQMRRFYPYLWIGFWVNASSGVALLAAYPAKALTNPDFYLKMMFIGLGVANMWLVEHFVVSDPDASTRPTLASSRAGFLRALCVCFGLLTASGIAILIVRPGTLLHNPPVYMRGGLIVFGLIYIWAIATNLRAIGNFMQVSKTGAPPRLLRVLAVTSFILWAGAIASGRFLAYTYSILTIS